MATVIHIPVMGWCVRPGGSAAHFFIRRGLKSYSACGGVERVDVYLPQTLRPQQAWKQRCLACERALEDVASLGAGA